MQQRRWYWGKAKELRGLTLMDAIPLATSEGRAFVMLLNVEYAQGDPESYVLPIAYQDRAQIETALRDYPQAIIARARDVSGQEGVLIDATANKSFAHALLEASAVPNACEEWMGKLRRSPPRRFRRYEVMPRLMLNRRCLGPNRATLR